MPGKPAKPLSLAASDAAPFLYFEVASNYGVQDAVARITLEADRALSVDGKVMVERVVVAHLRMSLAAAMSLRAALNGIALLARQERRSSVS